MRFFKKKKEKKENKYTVNIVEGLVCYCFRVYQKEIEEIIKKYHCKRVEEVQQHCSACQGCGGCRMDIEDLLAKINNKETP